MICNRINAVAVMWALYVCLFNVSMSSPLGFKSNKRNGPPVEYDIDRDAAVFRSDDSDDINGDAERFRLDDSNAFSDVDSWDSVESSPGGNNSCALEAYQVRELQGSPCDYYPNQTAPDGKWRFCGTNESNCYCNGSAAVCCGNLTQLPAFNTSITHLNITCTSLTRLDSRTLGNMAALQVLVIDKNNLTIITHDAFSSIPTLVHLQLVHNSWQIDVFNLTTALNELKNLTVLALNGTKIASSNSSQAGGINCFLKNLTLARLQVLYVDDLDSLQKTFFLCAVAHLTNLCVLSLRQHKLSEVLNCSESRSFCLEDIKHNAATEHGSTHINREPEAASAAHDQTFNFADSVVNCSSFTLSNLQVLDLGDNNLWKVPSFCCRYNISLVPRLWRLSLSLNGVIEPHSKHFHCLNRLTSLSLAGNPLKTLYANVFRPLTSLQDLDLRFTNIINAEANVFSHPTLRRVTIKSSNWFFDDKHYARLSPYLFNGSSLSYIDLSYNVFFYTPQSKIEEIFRPLKTVQHLIVTDIGFRRIPKVVTTSYEHLKMLTFQANLLTDFSSVKELLHLNGLERLDLSSNILSVMDTTVIKALLNKGVSINLEKNPFTCTCDLLQFLEMYKACRKDGRKQADVQACRDLVSDPGSGNLTGSFEGQSYKCSSPEHLYDIHLKDLLMTQQQCLLSLQQELFIFFCCGITIVAILTTAILYRYRWQIRLMLYVLHVQWKRRGSSGVEQRRARFTAFVSYSKRDTNFVIKTVLPTLEKGPRLPLCIHERDFTAGRYLADNIVQHMQHSKHVLLLLSNAFLQDDWCRFELYAAQHYALVRRQIPITIIRLEPLLPEVMDANVATLLQSTPYLDWPGRDSDHQATRLFWEHLNRSLGGYPVRQRARLLTIP